MKEFCSKRQPARMNAMDSRFLERAVKAIWKRSSKVVNKATHTVNNMVYIDGLFDYLYHFTAEATLF